jgi:hypothetical protein
MQAAETALPGELHHVSKMRWGDVFLVFWRVGVEKKKIPAFAGMTG